MSDPKSECSLDGDSMPLSRGKTVTDKGSDASRILLARNELNEISVDSDQQERFRRQWHHRTRTKNSAFAESLEEGHELKEGNAIEEEDEQHPSGRSMSDPSNQAKLEPREEPPGRRGREINSNLEIGLTNFLREHPRAQPAKRTMLSRVLHRSDSERRFLGSRKKTTGLVASKRMSDGRAYGQIVVPGFYDGMVNASTYKVNEVDDMKRLGRLKGKKLADKDSIAKRATSVKYSSKRREIDSEEMVDDTVIGGQVNGSLQDRNSRPSVEARREIRPISPAPVLPLRKAAESSFGVDFSSILKRHEESVPATPNTRKSKRGSFNTSIMTKSESRPNVRDFAEDTRSKLLPSAFRRRSRSPKAATPVKKEKPGKEAAVANERYKSSEEQDYSVYRRQINSIRDSVAQHAALAGLVPVDTSAIPKRQKSVLTTDSASKQGPSVRNSGISNSHSKTPSAISAGSGGEDNFSDISSAVISDAQSVPLQRPRSAPDAGHAVGIRKPAGPAPTGPLPSLPEGVDVQLPATPRLSESSQRGLSPERSPGKSWNRTPTRYKLTPSDLYPPKRPPSPERRNAVKDASQITRKPAALVRIHSANIQAFPSPPPSPERIEAKGNRTEAHAIISPSDSKSTIDDRSERTKKLKARDLAREKSLAAMSTPEPQPPLPIMINGSDGQPASIEKLIDAYHDRPPVEASHKAQPSLMSHFSNVSTQENEDSCRSSQQELSPIITVAEQRPSTYVRNQNLENDPHQRYPSHSKPLIDIESPSMPRLSPDHNKNSDPLALDIISGLEVTPEKPANRSVSSRVPTPFFPPISQPEFHHSSQRSSYIDKDLEARMTAMEKKNQLLEQAFLAVVDASASSMSVYSDGSQGGSGDRGSNGASVAGVSNANENGNGNGNGNGTRESNGSRDREYGTDKLCVSLERLLARHGTNRNSFHGGSQLE